MSINDIGYYTIVISRGGFDMKVEVDVNAGENEISTAIQSAMLSIDVALEGDK